MKEQIDNGNIPCDDDYPRLSKEEVNNYLREKEEEREKYPYISRNDFLRTLPKDEHGYPIVDRYRTKGNMFWKLSRIWGWEDDFLQEAVQECMIYAEEVPEFFQITDELIG